MLDGNGKVTAGVQNARHVMPREMALGCFHNVERGLKVRQDELFDDDGTARPKTTTAMVSRYHQDTLAYVRTRLLLEIADRLSTQAAPLSPSESGVIADLIRKG